MASTKRRLVQDLDKDAPSRKRLRLNGSVSVSPEQYVPKPTRSRGVGPNPTNLPYAWGKLPVTDEPEAADYTSSSDSSGRSGSGQSGSGQSVENKLYEFTDSKMQVDEPSDKMREINVRYEKRLANWIDEANRVSLQVHHETHEKFKEALEISKQRKDKRLADNDRDTDRLIEQFKTDADIQDRCSEKTRDDMIAQYRDMLETEILDKIDMLVAQGHIRAKNARGGDTDHEKHIRQKHHEIVAEQTLRKMWEDMPCFYSPEIASLVQIRMRDEDIARDLNDFLGDDDSSENEYIWNSRRSHNSNPYASHNVHGDRKMPRYRPTRATTEVRRLAHSVRRDLEVGFNSKKDLFWIGDSKNYFSVGTRVRIYSHVAGKASGYITGFNRGHIYVNVKTKNFGSRGSHFDVAAYSVSDIVSGEYAFHRTCPYPRVAPSLDEKPVEVKSDVKEIKLK